MALSPPPGRRHNAEPRITANDLAKYMVTPGPGRIGIIRKSRDSDVAPRARYTDARNGIKSYLLDKSRNKSTLHQLGIQLEQKTSDANLTNFQRQNASLSQAALTAFLRMESNLLSGLNFMAAPARQTPLAIGNVQVSINLDLLVGRERNGRTEVGGVLIRLTKTDEDETDAAAGKRKEMGLYAATLSQMQARSSVASGATVHHELCMSIDVQAGAVFQSGRNFLTRAQRIEAECRFIAAMWAEA